VEQYRHFMQFGLNPPQIYTETDPAKSFVDGSLEIALGSTSATTGDVIAVAELFVLPRALDHREIPAFYGRSKRRMAARGITVI
jgi:hypothetical protein